MSFDRNRIDVLDHGFVILRNVAAQTRRLDQEFDANDIDPANAARMSFDAMDSRPESDDLKLARYLMKNWHTSPFEMVQIWMEVKLPIFLARQFVRHRTARLNEISGRYVTLPAEWYIPDAVGGKPADRKQGQDGNLPLEHQLWFQTRLGEQCAQSYRTYLEAIDRKVAAEHARLLLHLNHYTHWLWNQDLHNMMHLLALRVGSHAQVEAQAYAQAKLTLLERVLPHSIALFHEYRKIHA